ncbi:MAG: energy-coupling factor ABC transporter ATP-binding protein [Peptococcaceae bacterium]|nr:energy-coupling factor ABC transporter ATP-binding protein [Peptococcaceae bacterium]
MIDCKNVSFSYPGSAQGALKNISVSIADGSFVLLCGGSGCGKTTLSRLFNGLIPHYHEGTLTGAVYVNGWDTRETSLFELSLAVGSVFQNPRAQFFNVDTTSELAFGPENHGLPEDVVRGRVAQVARDLHLTPLLERSIFSLSGGEKQRLACGSAAATEPEIFVLDEPSSNLDADATRDLRALLAMLKAQGKTVIVSEHRLYYLAGLFDRVLYMRDGEIAGDYTAAEFCQLSDAEREGMGLRPLDLASLAEVTAPPALATGEAWRIEKFSFAYKGEAPILDIHDATFPDGAATAIIGHNGAGKSTLARCLCGLEKRARGELVHAGARDGRKARLKGCYMVMQDVNHQLFCESVMEEILLSMAVPDAAQAQEILAAMDLAEVAEAHPMGLSGGQKQRVAVASALVSERSLVLFDEPTSGLDLLHMRQVAQLINHLTASGRTALVVTHDPEFILRACQHVLHLEKGRITESYSLATGADRARLLAFFERETKEASNL